MAMLIFLISVSTKLQLVDIFTKGLATDRFEFLCGKLRIMPMDLALLESVKDNAKSIIYFNLLR